MPKIFIVILTAVALAGCSQSAGGGATVGAASGAIIGGLTTGSWEGAAVGAALGGASGAIIGKAAEPGKCVYRDRRGREYVDAC